MSTSTSFGIKIGRGLGIIGALAVEGTVRTASGLGQFGADVVAGAEAGFDERSATLKASRATKQAARTLMLKNQAAASASTAPTPSVIATA